MGAESDDRDTYVKSKIMRERIYAPDKNFRRETV